AEIPPAHILKIPASSTTCPHVTFPSSQAPGGPGSSAGPATFGEFITRVTLVLDAMNRWSIKSCFRLETSRTSPAIAADTTAAKHRNPAAKRPRQGAALRRRRKVTFLPHLRGWRLR